MTAVETGLRPKADFSRIDAQIDQDRIVEFFKSIVAIPSPRYEEEAVARHIGNFLTGIGLRVEYQAFEQGGKTMYNVIGRYGNARGKKVVLCAHMDTGSGQYAGVVFQPDKWTKDPFQGVVEDGFFYGLGTHNDKQGICCMVMAIDAIVKSGIEIDGEIIVAPVSAETAMGVGAGHLVAQHGRFADYGIVLEGTGLDVCNVSVGKIRGRILVRGEHQHHSAHTNPNETLRYVLEAFSPGYGDNRAKTYLQTKVSEPDLPRVPSAAIRWIKSDLQSLDTVAAYFDIPVLHDQTPESVKADLERLITALRVEHPDLQADIEVQGWEPPFSGNFIWGAPGTPLTDPVVTTVAKHHEQVRGEKPVVGPGRRYGAASDASSFRRVGIPTVEYAPGAIGASGELKAWPAVDERVRLQDVVDCTRIVARAAAELANS